MEKKADVSWSIVSSDMIMYTLNINQIFSNLYLV